MRHFTKEDVLEYVAENDVKFLRMQFCDLNGTLRNVSIMPAGLEKAFDQGVPFDPSRIAAMVETGGQEMRLHPDPTTLMLLPWRPQHGRVARLLCGITHTDGRPYAGDLRAHARNASQRMREQGLTMRVGVKSAFTFFKLDETGAPTLTPHDNAGAYATSPLDRGENVRREVCLFLEEMGIQPESACHAAEPGQHEFVLAPQEAAVAADHFFTLESVVRAVAARNGLHATLMPRPLPASQGNYLYLSLTLERAAGHPCAPWDLAGLPDSFFRSIQGHLPEIYAFLASTTNSYNRRDGQRVPAPMIKKGEGIELLCADSALNPYLAVAVLQAAGLRGATGEALPPSTGPEGLPSSLEEAICLTQDSALCQDALGKSCLNACLTLWKKDCDAWRAAPSAKLDWERERYFTLL